MAAAVLSIDARVVAAYEAIRAECLSFPADKAAVMRLLAPRFTKNEMRRVYAAIVAARGDAGRDPRAHSPP